MPRFSEVDPFRVALDRVAPPRSPQLPQFDPPPRSPEPPPPPSDRRMPAPPPSSAPSSPPPPPPPPLEHWTRSPAARSGSGRAARSRGPITPPRSASRRPRRPPAFTLRQALEWGDRLFRGKLLFWLFGAWALLWLLGGVAMVGLVTIDRRPLAPEAPAIAPSPIPEPPQTPVRQPAVFEDDTPMAGYAGGRDRAAVVPTLPASRPPVALFAGAAFLCGLGSWVRLRQILRSPGPRPPHRLPR